MCLSKNEVPTREECFELLREYNVPENVVRHTLLVDKVAIFLAQKLKDSGLNIDVDLVDRAALLHDLDKMQTLDKDTHGLLTENILTKKGYPKLGRVIKHHRFKYIYNTDLSWEEKILNYADKRVNNDKLVAIDERFAYFRKRYNIGESDRDKEAERLFRELEKQIFSRIGLKPEDLGKYVE